MSDKTIKLTRRRAIGGLITIGGAAAAAGAGTFALFSDTETSSGNTITAGTLNLTGPSDATLTASNLAPGESVPSSGTATIQATYDSGSSIDPVKVDLSIANSEPSSEPTEPSNSTDQTASAFAQQLNVDTANLTKNGSVQEDLTSSQGVSTADDLDGLSLADAFGDVSPSNTVGLELAFTFDSNAGNEYQADGVSITVDFTAEQ
ncbi:TasA family protein [Halobacteriales archaeon Cl-PHB]